MLWALMKRVIPALVAGIQLATCAGVWCWLDAGDKPGMTRFCGTLPVSIPERKCR
jgi:hypothetical protein